MANPWSGSVPDYRRGADPNIVKGWTDLAAAQGQGSVIKQAGSMASMAAQMAEMWMQYKTKTFEDDKKAMDKFIPQEGEAYNVTKDMTPQTQALMSNHIAVGRKAIFEAIQKNDKPEVARLMGQLNSVTDQFKIINDQLANHKKNYDEGNYSAASDHFDMAQLSTGKYTTIVSPEGEVSLAMYDKDQNQTIYTADMLSQGVVVKQRDIIDKMKQIGDSKFKEHKELDDMEFPEEFFKSYAEQVTERSEVVTSLAYDDLFRNGGKNVMWKLRDNEAKASARNQEDGLVHIPESITWADPFSSDFDPTKLKTHVIGIDGDGEYVEGGLMHHFESQWNQKANAYTKKRNTAAAVAEAKKNAERVPKARDMFTVNMGHGSQNKMELQRQTLDSYASAIGGGRGFAFPGKGKITRATENGKPATRMNDVTGVLEPLFAFPIMNKDGTESGKMMTGVAWEVVRYLDLDAKGKPQGLLTTYPMFSKFQKPIAY